MRNLESRLSALEATRKPALQILFIRGETTPEQAAQIDRAQSLGLPLRVIQFWRMGENKKAGIKAGTKP